MNSFFMSDITQESVQGTTTPVIDYLNAIPSVAGTNLEDVTRFNTSTSQYALATGFSIIAPMTSMNNQLSSKFLFVDIAGHESDCSNQYDFGCESFYLRIPTENIPVITTTHGVAQHPTSTTVQDINLPITQNNCSMGVYKPAKTTSIQSLEYIGENIKLHPNPADNEVNITAATSMWGEGITIDVVDILGKHIYSTQPAPDSPTVQINTSTWAPGTYIVNIHLQDGRSVNKKLTIN